MKNPVEGGVSVCVRKICSVADWSRSARKKRKLEKAGASCSQTKITDYFEVLNNIQKLERENAKLATLLQHLRNSDYKESKDYAHSSLTPILKQILLNSQANAEKLPKQRRHPEVLKTFSTALLIYAGPLAYEFLHQNMPEALPSLRTAQNIVQSEYSMMHEGSFQFDRLLEHIELHNSSTCVSIGEDATRIISRVEYDPKSNRCVGFVLPVSKDGLPEVDSFLAVSFKAIENMFNSATVAKYAYVYMAQPLSRNTPPFCLSCMGTDNKFTAEEVLKRWKYIAAECANRGMHVVSFGGDGDSRLMKAMRISTSLSTPAQEPLLHESPVSLLKSPAIPRAWKSWLHLKPTSISFVQDTVHIAVKMKSRLLKPSVILALGQYVAGGHHIRMLQLLFGKDQHGLRERDVNHKDKQNFDAVLHIISGSHLLENISDAAGTKCYVKLIECIVESYLDKSLAPVQRIEKIWFSCAFGVSGYSYILATH